MANDIRMALDFPSHRKTLKLIRQLGPGAPLCLIRLWGYAANRRQDGSLAGLSNEDIAIESGWDGDPSEWVQALAEIGWLDLIDGTYWLHDWPEHQPWIYGARDRSENARRAAMAKHKKSSNDAESCAPHATRMRPACDPHAPRYAPSPSPLPSPSPNPSPTPSPSPIETSDAPAMPAGVEGKKGPRSRSKKTTEDVSVEREDVDRLCRLLADLVEANGSRRPAITRAWLDNARLMLDADRRRPDEAEHLIRWSQADTFWRANILSMPTFRRQYDKIRLQAERRLVTIDGGRRVVNPAGGPTDDDIAAFLRSQGAL